MKIVVVLMLFLCTQCLPRAQETNVVGNLHQRAGQRVELTRGLDNGVVGSERLELVRGCGVRGGGGSSTSKWGGRL
jgi:hypothetical protein